MDEQKIIEKLNKCKNNNKMDKLEMLFDLQNMFDEYIKDKRNLDYSNIELWIQNMCIAIITEACELNDTCNWKWWKNKKDIDWNNVKEEIIDLWHFLLSLSIKVGLTPNDIINQYIIKNIENYNRQLGNSERSDYQYNYSKL